MTKLYGASWCPACQQAKKWLDSNGYSYEYVDVDTSEGKSELATLGFRSIPVLEANSETVLGFNADKYKTLLG